MRIILKQQRQFNVQVFCRTQYFFLLISSVKIHKIFDNNIYALSIYELRFFQLIFVF